MKDRKGKTLKATGDCFRNSARFVLEHPEMDGVEFFLVHAIATGQGDIQGIEFSHAFVVWHNFLSGTEYAVDITADVEKPLVVPLEIYRTIGNVKNEIRYSKEETRTKILDIGTWGPWDKSISTEADRFCKGS